MKIRMRYKFWAFLLPLMYLIVSRLLTADSFLFIRIVVLQAIRAPVFLIAIQVQKRIPELLKRSQENELR